MEDNQKGYHEESGMIPLQNNLTYARLKRALDQLSDKSEKRFAGMVTKKFKSGRGGYRGKPKPKTDPELKREVISIRLPKHLLDRLREKENMSREIETALLAFWGDDSATD